MRSICCAVKMPDASMPEPCNDQNAFCGLPPDELPLMAHDYSRKAMFIYSLG